MREAPHGASSLPRTSHVETICSEDSGAVQTDRPLSSLLLSSELANEVFDDI
jgi:hypothetical protein